MHVLSAVSKSSSCSSIDKTTEAFSTEMIEAIYRNRILEGFRFQDRRTPPALLAEYVFRVAVRQNVGQDQYPMIKAISETADFLLEKAEEYRLEGLETEWDRDMSKENIIQKLCHMVVEGSRAGRPVLTFKRIALLESRWSFGRPPCEYPANIGANAVPAAIHFGASSLAKILITNGIGRQETNFGDPITCAIKRQNEGLVLMLLKTGSWSLEARHAEQAAQQGSKSILDMLLESAHQDQGTEISSFYIQAIRGAAANGNLQLIQYLTTKASSRDLLASMDIDETMVDICEMRFQRLQIPPKVSDLILLAAIPNGHIDIVRYALAHGAGPTTVWKYRNDFVGTIESAARHGWRDIVQLLLERGGKDQGPAHLTISVNSAFKMGWVSIGKLLLDWGALLMTTTSVPRINDFGTFGKTVKRGQAESVRFLLDNMPDELKNDRQDLETGYREAKRRGYISIAEYIANSGVFTTEELMAIGA
jgi:ankyrin repeat protein